MLINLRVKTLDAQTHDFSIDNELTIREFKDKIAEKTNISADQQRIIYCGRVLADEKQLKEYDVDGKVVHVAERPPPSQRGPSSSNSSSNDTPNTRERTNNRGMRNSPLFRALDGMVVGTMAIPMNPVQNNGQQQVNPFAASSSFCMNRITVARHMLDCANNIAAYLEDPERGLNNASLDILARGSWTMESTVVEVGFTAADLPQNQNIVEMVQDAVSAALRRNSNTNVTVVQLPTVFGSNEGEAAATNGAEGVANMDATESNASVDADVDADGDADAAAAVIIEDVIDDAYEGVAANLSLASDTTGTSSTNNTTSSTNTTSDASTTDISSASTTTGTNTEENPSRRRTNTRVLAEVVEQMRTVQTRLNPFIQQFYELLNNDPTYEEENTTDRDNAQRLYNRVSEALHYMSHAQHAISDLMLDVSQPAPRFLTCRPILVEQSGYVSSNNYLSAAAAAAAAAASGNNQQRPRSRTTFISPRRDHAVTITTLSPPTTASGNANSTASGNTPVTAEAGNSSGYVNSNNYLSAAASAAAAAATAATGNNQHRSRSRATFISPRRDHAITILSPPTTASGNANSTAGGNTAVAAEAGNNSGGSSSAGSGGADGSADNNRNSNSTTASASGSGSGSSIDDPVDEPLTNPNATSTAAAANAATQSNDDSAIEIMLQPRRGLYFGNNPQVQMSRLIQAMVNSAPINTELHVQILPPTILSVPVNARDGNNGNGEQQQRATAATTADATATAATNNSNNNANANATGSSSGSGSGANANNNHSNNAAPAAGIVLNPNSGYRPVSASLAIGTLPTTSTQTRSTSRPQLQIGGLPANGWNGRFIPANMMSSFDRFLPCNSHHIREPENGNNSNAANASAPSNGNGNANANANASMNNATPHIITTNTINPHSLRAFADLLPNVRSTPTVGGAPSGTTRTNAPPPPPRPALPFFSLRNLISGQNRNTPTAPAAPSTSGTAAAAAASSSASSSAANTDNYRRNLRTQLQNFVNQRIFGGGPINEETMSPAVNRAVDWFGESLELLPQYEKPEYDSRHSVVKLLRHMLPLFIEIVRDEQSNLAAFEQRIKRACEDFVKRLYSVLYVCVGRNNAQQYWVQLMRLLWVPTRSYFRGEALRFLSMYINTVNPSNTDTADVQQYIVHRDVPSVAQSDAPLETDVEMVEVASTSEANPHSQFSIDIDDADDDVELELAPAEPLPNVNAGSEPWHRNFPTDWLPIITRDLHTQSANPPNQTPFSDAYISGMSAKRRKMIQNNKPPTDINALVARSVRKAIQTVGPRASTTAAAESLTAEEITEAIANDATVHTSFRDAVRTNVRERLQKDTNYKAEKFPHTAKFVNK
ncbi:large proline-rich protein BAG6 isoform X2 [Bactrocera neohumeralis]|uniref:large proline-rich protein BAG6 isoform X2 n=1 Tax=Bactrocera neohumeralis TaxID=98809 RepID=UPI0021651B00|nr:large proline-rich protein BAG6 isoform X2 [Bactrocera neohumeralis]